MVGIGAGTSVVVVGTIFGVHPTVVMIVAVVNIEVVITRIGIEATRRIVMIAVANVILTVDRQMTGMAALVDVLEDPQVVAFLRVWAQGAMDHVVVR